MYKNQKWLNSFKVVGANKTFLLWKTKLLWVFLRGQVPLVLLPMYKISQNCIEFVALCYILCDHNYVHVPRNVSFKLRIWICCLRDSWISIEKIWSHNSHDPFVVTVMMNHMGIDHYTKINQTYKRRMSS